MTVSQFIKVTNPPARSYVMRATMPLPFGTDPTAIGNSLKAPQQYRLIGRMRRWELYEWMVYAPAGTQQVDISEIYAPTPQQRKTLLTQLSDPGAPGGRVSRPRPAANPIDSILSQYLPTLKTQGAFALKIKRADGIEETVSLTGPELGTPVRHGPLRVTRKKHTNTIYFMRLHHWWDVIANDPVVRLTINLHSGCPGQEPNFQSILFITPPGVRWTTELNDPACAPDDPDFPWLVKPATTNHLFPRQAQRSFRLLIYPDGLPEPTNTQDPGWGMADWSDGGLFPADLALHALAHITGPDIATRVVADANNVNNNLGALVNGGVGLINGGPPCPSFLWPVLGQQYGGPTGSDGHYRPYNGVKTAAANRREGILYHKVLSLRHQCRNWDVVYEEDGEPCIPENHLDTDGAAQWQHYVGNGTTWANESGSGSQPYGLWKDSGFDFDQYRTKFQPRDYELLSEGATTRWQPWDEQHGMFGWQDDLALAWLDADPLAIQNLTMMAEMARVTYWTGTGAAQRLTLPSATGEGVNWGRDVSWSMYKIATAAVFNLGEQNLEDDVSTDTTTVFTLTRRSRWLRNQLEVFIQGTEKAMMPTGCAWCLSSGKVATDEPFGAPNSGAPIAEYFVQQVFEVNYGMTALMACYGVFGNFWITSLGAAEDAIDVLELVRKWARCLDTVYWGTTVGVDTPSISAAGTGYTALDTVTLLPPNYVWTGGAPPSPLIESVLRVSTVGGSGEATALAVVTAGQAFQKPASPTQTYSTVDNPTVSAGGTGYSVGNLVTVVGGTPIAAVWRAVFKVQTVSGGVVTSLISGGGTGAHPGKYLVPPPAATAATTVSGGPGAGLVVGFTRSATGSGLTTTQTWTAPVRTGTQPLKIAPHGPYPGSSRYTTRADFVPASIMNDNAAMAAGYYNGQGAGYGQQALESASVRNVMGLIAMAGAAEAAQLLLDFTGQVTIAAAVNVMKNWGVGGNSTVIENLENFYPPLAFYDPPT